MGRYARQTIANTPYHIINRGNNHQPVFYCDDDHRTFIEAIETAKGRYPCRIYSFVLMTNHVFVSATKNPQKIGKKRVTLSPEK